MIWKAVRAIKYLVGPYYYPNQSYKYASNYIFSLLEDRPSSYGLGGEC